MPDKYPKFKVSVAQLLPSFFKKEETVEISPEMIISCLQLKQKIR